MIQFLPLLAPVIVFTLLIAVSHYILKRHAVDQKAWYLIVRAILPIVAIVLLNIMYFAASLFYPGKVTGDSLYEVVSLLAGFAACLLLTFDVIRCRKWFMKALGITYLIAAVGIFLVGLSSAV